MAEKKHFHRIQIDKQLLTCPMCWKLFTDPRTLACNHTVCKSCLLSLVDYTRSSRIECPSCQASTELGKEQGVDALKSNHYARYLVQQVREQRLEDLCEQCHDVTATVRCTICVVKLCGGCADAHMSDMTTVHDLAFLLEEKEEKRDLADLSHTSSTSSDASMTIDDLPFDVYCEQCKTTDCDHCVNMKKVALRNIKQKRKKQPSKEELGGEFELVVVSQFGGDDAGDGKGESLKAVALYGDEGEKLLQLAQTPGSTHVTRDVIPRDNESSSDDSNASISGIGSTLVRRYPMASTPNDASPADSQQGPALEGHTTDDMIEAGHTAEQQAAARNDAEDDDDGGKTPTNDRSLSPHPDGNITPQNEQPTTEAANENVDGDADSQPLAADVSRTGASSQQSSHSVVISRPETGMSTTDDQSYQQLIPPDNAGQTADSETAAVDDVTAPSPRGVKRPSPTPAGAAEREQESPSPQWETEPEQAAADPSQAPPVQLQHQALVHAPAQQQQQQHSTLGSGFKSSAARPLEGVIEEEHNPEREAALGVPRSSTPTNETPDMRRKNRLGFSLSRTDDSLSDRGSVCSAERQVSSPAGSQEQAGLERQLMSPTGSQRSVPVSHDHIQADEQDVRRQIASPTDSQRQMASPTASQHSVPSNASNKHRHGNNTSAHSNNNGSASQASIRSVQGSAVGSAAAVSDQQHTSSHYADTVSAHSGSRPADAGARRPGDVKLPSIQRPNSSKKGTP